jgi:hypothetical protein
MARSIDEISQLLALLVANGALAFSETVDEDVLTIQLAPRFDQGSVDIQDNRLDRGPGGWKVSGE